MKKLVMIVSVLMSMIFGGVAFGSNIEPVMGVSEIKGGSNVFFGKYEINLNLTSIPNSGERFLIGESLPEREWMQYLVQDLSYSYHLIFEIAFLDEAGYFPTSQAEKQRLWTVFNSTMKRMGRVILDWPKGEDFEFSFGIQNEGWVSPLLSQYLYPRDVSIDEQHFRVVLGSKERCLDVTGDKLILNIEDEGNGWYKVYINAFCFPWDRLIKFRNFLVTGQNMPGDKWVEYEVVENYPCYYFRVFWPHTETFEFTFGIELENGGEIYIDPNTSTYKYEDHLGIKF